jgi:hypothetical protein
MRVMRVTILPGEVQSWDSSACAHPRRHDCSWHESGASGSIAAKAQSCHQADNWNHANWSGHAHLLAVHLILVLGPKWE